MEEGVYESGGLGFGAEPQEPVAGQEVLHQEGVPPWLDRVEQEFAGQLGEGRFGAEQAGPFGEGDFEDDPFYEGDAGYDDELEGEDDFYPEDMAGSPDPDSLDAEDEDDEADAQFRRMLGIDDDDDDEIPFEEQFTGEELERFEAMKAREAEVGARLGELEEQWADEQFERLAEDFPEIEDPAVAAEVADGALWLADRLGNPEIAEHPEFARVAYLALKGLERAESEEPIGPDRAVALEGASAAPADPGPEHESVFHQLHAEASARRASRLWR